MNLRLTTSLLLLLTIVVSFAAEKPAYKLYNSKGKEIKYKKMIKELADADVIFFGEYHNNAIAHWLELKVTQSLYAQCKGAITMGAEMFEADNQMIIDEYMNSQISMTSFESECRLWPNYETDYEPLISFAKDSAIHFVATNIPRRYASIVHKKGMDKLDDLSDEARRYIAPLPIALESDSILESKMGPMSMMSKNPIAIAKAQAIKDATMAHFISENFKKGKLFIHYNGSFHSDDESGIRKYLNIYQPGLKVMTITTASQDDIEKLDEAYVELADYVICVPSDMTRTY